MKPSHNGLKRSGRVLLYVLLLKFMCVAQCMEDSASGSRVRDSIVSSFTGCYQLTVGRWWPWGFGDEAHYVTPPTRIRLLSEHGTHGFEQDGYLLRSIPKRERPPGSRESSYWRATSPNQIDLIWNDGFVGVRLSLEKNGNELHGWAHPHFDASKLIPRTARVDARPIACDNP